MNLQAIKEKIEGLKEDKARAEERLKNLNEKKEEILGELKEYGVENIDDIDGKVKKLKKDLDKSLKDFDEVKTEEEDEQGKMFDKLLEEQAEEVEDEMPVVGGKAKKSDIEDLLKDL